MVLFLKKKHKDVAVELGVSTVSVAGVMHKYAKDDAYFQKMLLKREEDQKKLYKALELIQSLND